MLSWSHYTWLFTCPHFMFLKVPVYKWWSRFGIASAHEMFLVNVFPAFGLVGSYREGREKRGGSGLKEWQMIQEIMIKPREAVPDSQRDWFRWCTNQYRLGINQIICIWFHSYLPFVNATYILTSAQVLYRLTLQHRFLFMEGKGSVYTWHVKIGIFRKHSKVFGITFLFDLSNFENSLSFWLTIFGPLFYCILYCLVSKFWSFLRRLSFVDDRL